MMSRIIGGKEYTTAQVRRLKRYVCAWCEQPLDREACGSIFFLSDADRCSPSLLAKKRDDCIAASHVRGAVMSNDYDLSIHTNPDAMAWTIFFREKNPDCNVPDDVMLGWFANAMMAMHDHLHGGGPLNGDHAQYLLDVEAGRVPE